MIYYNTSCPGAYEEGPGFFIVALIFTVLIHIAERALIGEYANVDSAAFLDFIYGSVHDRLSTIRGLSIMRCILCTAAGKRSDCKGQSMERRSYFFEFIFNFLYLISIDLLGFCQPMHGI